MSDTKKPTMRPEGPVPADELTPGMIFEYFGSVAARQAMADEFNRIMKREMEKHPHLSLLRIKP